MNRKTAEDYFAEGVDAFNKGLALKDCPYTAANPGSSYDWSGGWNSRYHRKLADFQNYRKTKTLFDKEHTPPGREKMLHNFQEARKRTIVALEAEWPDFAAAYSRLNK